MSKDEIIDKIEDMAYCGEEFEAAYVTIERLKAVIACMENYCEDNCEGTQRIYISAMLKLSEEIINKIDKKTSAIAQAIIDVIRSEQKNDDNTTNKEENNPQHTAK